MYDYSSTKIVHYTSKFIWCICYCLKFTLSCVLLSTFHYTIYFFLFFSGIWILLSPVSARSAGSTVSSQQRGDGRRTARSQSHAWRDVSLSSPSHTGCREGRYEVKKSSLSTSPTDRPPIPVRHVADSVRPTADRPPRAANYNLDHASHACVCGPCARFGAAIATGDGRARACARWLRLPCSPRSPCTRSSRTSRRCPFQTSRTTSRTRRCCTCTCPLGRSRHGSSRRLVKGGSRREASGGVWSHIES